MARQPQNVTEDRAKSKRISALGALWPFMAPYRAMMAAAVLALVATAIISLLLPMAVRRVVDSFDTGSAELLDKYFGAALIITLARDRHGGRAITWSSAG